MVVEVASQVRAVPLDGRGGAQPPGRAELWGHVVGTLAGGRAVEQREQVPLRGLVGGHRPADLVGDLTELGRHDGHVIERLELAGGDEAPVGEERPGRLGGAGGHVAQWAAVDGGPGRGEVKLSIPGRVEDRLVVDGDAADAAAGGAPDPAGLEVRPALTALSALAAAPDLHRSGFGRGRNNRVGSWAGGPPVRGYPEGAGFRARIPCHDDRHRRPQPSGCDTRVRAIAGHESPAARYHDAWYGRMYFMAGRRVTIRKVIRNGRVDARIRAVTASDVRD